MTEINYPYAFAQDDPNSQPNDRAFIELAGNKSRLEFFSLSTFGDCCTTFLGTPIVGGIGSLRGGTVTSNGDVLLKGDVQAVTFHSAAAIRLHVDGDVRQTSVYAPKGIELAVTGALDLDDQLGGRLVHQQQLLNSSHNGNYELWPGDGTGGMLRAVLSGASLMIQCIAFEGHGACAPLGAPLVVPGSPGRLELVCAVGVCVVHGHLAAAGNGTMEVRRLAGGVTNPYSRHGPR